MKSPFFITLLSLGLLSACMPVKEQTPVMTPPVDIVAEHKQQLFDISAVRITDGPFAHAQALNLEYLLALQADKLLAPYLREAGLESASPSYKNWENSGLDGHIGGHYLSALSLAWAATGNSEIKQRLDYMLNQLQKAQQENGGYLGGIPDGKAMWEEIRQGNIKAELFSLNDRWVPLYNIDKIFHGLKDAYLIASSEQAKNMLLSLGQWILDLTKDLSDEQIQQMLYSEHGGLNEVFADLSEISGNKQYLELARKFSHNKILTPLVNKTDELTGLHANTQIPKIVGALKVAQLNQNQDWQEAAAFFWETVTQDRTVSIGGNSVSEHFHDTNDFTAMVENIEGPETCNTYNMLKLSKLLFLHSGDTRYIDYYERATYNHILSSQHPTHGGLVYFTSMRPGHYRMYSSIQDSMWCCVGSGIENHSKYGELIYSHSDDDLFVNLFINSSLKWQQKNVEISLNTFFPDQNQVTLSLKALSSTSIGAFNLRIRKPNWADSGFKVKVNGSTVKALESNNYIVIQGNWQDDDVISFELPAKLQTVQLPDGQNYYSVLYGPVVLSTKIVAFEDEKLNFIADDSRMGHVAAGPICPPEALPMIIGNPQDFLNSLTRANTPELAFTSTANMTARDITNGKTTESTLIPFFRLHDSRYQVYWPQLSKSEFEKFGIEANERNILQQQLRKITVDQITPGQQQPEVEHQFKGENTSAGIHLGRQWRDARAWFQYQLDNQQTSATHLRITYFKGDANRRFTIKVNGLLLSEVTLSAQEGPDDFYELDYPLTDEMRSEKLLTLRFDAGKDSIAGGIYGIRLISK